MECLRPIDPLIAGLAAFAAYEVPGRVCNAVLGAVPGHPAIEALVALSQRTVGTGVYPSATATDFATVVLEAHDDVNLFGPEVFYPYRWDEPGRRDERFGEAYAIHHWARAWAAGAA